MPRPDELNSKAAPNVVVTPAPIALVVAMAENRIIGLGGAMPWHLPSDLKTFRRLTLDKPIIMGRKTFAAIGRALDRRTSIVVSRSPRPVNLVDDRVVWAASIDAAITIGREIARRDSTDEVMVVGGGEIYAQAMPHAHRVYLTIVHAAPNGDTRFPELGAAWHEVHREALPRAAGDTSAATFTVLERLAGGQPPGPA